MHRFAQFVNLLLTRKFPFCLALPNSYPAHFSAGKDTEEQKGSFYLIMFDERCAFSTLEACACFKFDDFSK